MCCVGDSLRCLVGGGGVITKPVMTMKMTKHPINYQYPKRMSSRRYIWMCCKFQWMSSTGIYPENLVLGNF